MQVESDAEYFSIVQYLHKLGIVRPIAERDIFTVNGKKVLNGMFAVIKKGTPLYKKAKELYSQ